MEQALENSQTAYSRLCSDRDLYLERARESAKYTIPYLVPDDGHTTSTKFPSPWQSVGAFGVNALANKLVLSILPANAPFFRFVIDPFELRKENIDPKMKTEIDKALAEIERSIYSQVQTSSIRSKIFNALRLLIVAGNVAIYVPVDDEDGIRTYRLENYVAERDSAGNLIRVITCEKISPSTLEADIFDKIKTVDTNIAAKPEAEVEIYTSCVLSSDGKRMWEVKQEIAGVQVGAVSTYPYDRNPFMVLRMNPVDGEDYGRGLVEEYLGDFRSLDSLNQSVVEGSAAAAKILFMVSPNGTTRIEDCAKSDNGDFISGNSQDVTTLQLNKQADLGVASQIAGRIEERLKYAFLMSQSIQRDAERVTAQEVSIMARELESTLGGVYSLLAVELQLPLANLLMYRQERKGKLPKLPKNIVKPTIITGVEALGRGNDLEKLDMLVGGIERVFGPGSIQQFMSPTEYMKRRANALSIDTEGLVYTQEEIQQSQQQAQMMQMAQTVAPNAVKAMGDQAMAQASAQMQPQA